jgi:anti-sigma factor RsiW
MAHDLSPDEMVCRELVELATDYFEGALPPDQRARFEAHLAACPPCGDYLDQLRRTVHALGCLGALPASPEERARLLTLFQRWRDQPAG